MLTYSLLNCTATFLRKSSIGKSLDVLWISCNKLPLLLMAWSWIADTSCDNDGRMAATSSCTNGNSFSLPHCVKLSSHDKALRRVI